MASCKDGLPTVVNLRKKQVLTDDICWLCFATREDTTDAVVNCPTLQGLRRFFLPDLMLDNNMSLLEMAIQIYDRKLYEQFAILFVLAWSFWFHRNKYVHDNELLSPKVVAENASVMLHS